MEISSSLSSFELKSAWPGQGLTWIFKCWQCNPRIHHCFLIIVQFDSIWYLELAWTDELTGLATCNRSRISWLWKAVATWMRCHGSGDEPWGSVCWESINQGLDRHCRKKKNNKNYFLYSLKNCHWDDIEIANKIRDYMFCNLTWTKSLSCIIHQGVLSLWQLTSL